MAFKSVITKTKIQIPVEFDAIAIQIANPVDAKASR